jgi:transposase InsO family protein
MVSPARRRAAVAYLQRRHKVSQRRACRVIEQCRSTQRYLGVPPDRDAKLAARMSQLAEERPKAGYRMIHSLLVSDGWQVNRKRVHRLWVLDGHQQRAAKGTNSGKKAGGMAENSAWNLPATRPHHIWSYDFMSAATSDGMPFRILNVVDEYTRLAVGFHVARNIGARDVAAQLEKMFARHGAPAIIRSDNGREFIADTLVTWLTDRHVTPAFIEKASPQQNCYGERFNGTMRRECLNGEEFDTVLEARVVIGRFIEDYNERRPHRGLGMRTPRAFADEMIGHQRNDSCEGAPRE